MALLPVGRQLTESVRWYTPRKMMNRFMLIPEVHLLLLRASKILLLRRYQTGYEDGNYSVVADHVDGNEPATVTVAREIYEEAGIVIDPADLVLAHLLHRKAHDERMSLFSRAKQWHGEPANKEQKSVTISAGLHTMRSHRTW